MATSAVIRPLTSKQERKLVNYLDERLLEITRNHKKRSEISSSLQTLSAYIEAVRAVLVLVLQIPPLDPSTGLRIAYLLRLTGDLLGAIPGYKLETQDAPMHATLQDLLDFLDDVDQAWIIVLQGQLWDPAAGEGLDLVVPIDLGGSSTSNGDTTHNPSPKLLKSSPPSQTDMARLRSLLFSGESTLEEWILKERQQVNTLESDGAEDISTMLAQMGLLDQFDSLFVRTLDYLGGFGSRVSQNTVDPEMEVTME